MESAEPWLLRLPPAALERIWVLLRTRHWSEDEWDQHALRCTCRALRAATAPLVPACLHIRAPRTAPWDEPPDTAGLSTPEILSSHAQDCLQDAWEQFEDYPSDCHLCALDLQFSEPWFADDRDIHLGNRPVMPAIIPTFFLLEGRLSKLLRLKLACTLVMTQAAACRRQRQALLTAPSITPAVPAAAGQRIQEQLCALSCVNPAGCAH